ncbi:NADH-quinone oxidoreductase subunit J [Flavobacterium franklandianum]|uniref:NADH-quinone oxidoreductase subunit J n=1 Tax=Flavobacterium franklandianum TaxID=2594430 RepID=A0A553C7F6_9FLAO|nr:NADH-quinone oxidoreductase subunit J [Flavobacterium franklandianum]TRX16439.1 NADH-quinone oxidoreductase subunit J [Flavobacterium franklandianum]TRX25475.1 NADH-quinone oxidoreductase subunit J [Flavobacterium franklandianum]
MEKIVFYILALIMIVSAIASVSSRKMLRSVIYLLFVLIGVAGIYFLIDYNFLAAVQLTVYAGGIIVLVIFSVLLVHHIEMELEMAQLSKKILTGISCLIGLGLFLFIIYTNDFKVVENSKTTSVEAIGRGLLSYDSGGFILPFEVISILLLAAMIGAIIIGKGDKLTKNDDTL